MHIRQTRASRAREAAIHREPALTSLGLAVIDEIRFGNGEVVKDVLGGSGTYCTVGARLFAADNPLKISWMVRGGNDFPSGIDSLIRSWDIDYYFVHRVNGERSTCGLLRYADTTFGPKTFQYTTPVLPVTSDDIYRNGNLLRSRSFQTLCDPVTVQQQTAEIIQLRSGSGLPRPLIVWEPLPSACIATNLSAYLAAMKDVDVFSPNHLELLALFGVENEPLSTSVLEQLGKHCVDSGIGPEGNGIVVVRAGEHGCILASQDIPPMWFPSYYGPNGIVPAGDKIVDTTGAGNAFLGGFAMGYLETESWMEACCFGAVAASFVLEQIGVPLLERREGGEYWNGESARVRLSHYRESLDAGVLTAIPENGRLAAGSMT